MNDSTLARFWAKVAKAGPDECWLWTGARGGVGYGSFAIDARRKGPGTKGCAKTGSAHRAIYEHVHGPVPPGLEIDHLCRVRLCVNPAHLEAVTPQINNRRGVSPAALNARKTHCHRGHEFTEANTYMARKGSRICRRCHADRERNRRTSTKAAA